MHNKASTDAHVVFRLLFEALRWRWVGRNSPRENGEGGCNPVPSYIR